MPESSARDRRVGELALALRHLSSQAGFLTQAVADRLGINATDLVCLGLLDADGPMTAGRLAELTGLSTGAITGVVDRLEKHGFVRRDTDPADRRRVIVQLVPQRAPDVAQAFAPLTAAAARAAEDWPGSELDRLVGFARRGADLLREHTTELRGATPRAGEQPAELTAPVGDLAEAVLRFPNGARRLAVRAGATPGDLFRARFERAVPEVTVSGGVVTMRYTGSPVRRARARAEVALHRKVSWRLEVDRGLAGGELDLHELRLAGVTIAGGATDLVVSLPRPGGEVTVHVDGGVSGLELRRPAGVPVRVRIARGVRQLDIDDLHVGSAGGDLDRRSPRFDAARNRYDVVIRGGATRVRVTPA